VVYRRIVFCGQLVLPRCVENRTHCRLQICSTTCLCLASAALLAGCTHLGYKTIAVDRFDYSSAIGDSWKRQALMDIVKLRYIDLPLFVNVASIVAG
jgi:hypothetical protein